MEGERGGELPPAGKHVGSSLGKGLSFPSAPGLGMANIDKGRGPDQVFLNITRCFFLSGTV